MFIFFLNTQVFEGQTYGLNFKGIESTIDKRTELNLTPNDYLEFNEEFEISFDYKVDFIRQEGLFGYVFRVINKDNFNVDLVNSVGKGINLNLVSGKNNAIVPVKIKDKGMPDWVKLRIKFFLAENRLVFYTPDSMYVHDVVGFKGNDSFKIIFGANDFDEFKTSDVPPMSIKDIRIIEKGKLKYYWPLDETDKNVVQDRIKGKEATVKNPLWLRKSHQDWRSIVKKEYPGNVMTAFDPKSERFFLVGEKSLDIYDPKTNQTETVTYKESPLFITSSYRAVYDSLDNKIYCYLIDGPPFYVLDVGTGKWDKLGKPSKYKTKYLHHNSAFYEPENSIYAFGGYGRHTYNNEIKRIDLGTETWSDLPTNDSVFPPRYLAGLGVLNDTIYMLGGYGSVSGSQLINPHSYFNLFGYSIKDSTLFEKFEIPHYLDDMVVGNTMWIDDTTKDYYALVFEKNKFEGELQLIKGNINEPQILPVGTKIPFKFLDIKSSTGLFYFSEQNKLVAYTTYLTDANNTQFQLSSIDYPPNEYQEDLGTETKPTLSQKYYYILLFLFFIIGLGTIYYVLRSKKTERNKPGDLLKPLTQNNIHTGANGNEILQPLPTAKIYQLIFFGGFQAFDKEGADITNKFSPLLKELFLLIWLNTFDNGKGISSEKITELLWFDKTEISARNNRAVNIKKLRNILERLGDCELTKETAYWKIVISENRFESDYLDFLKITSTDIGIDKQKIKELIDISEKGAFLFNVHYEWLDKFKAEVSDRIIDTLVNFAEQSDISDDPELFIQLSDCIFNFDSVNEEAMTFKCKAQYHMGKHSLAKLTYENFVKEYKQIYNEEYDISFGEVIR